MNKLIIACTAAVAICISLTSQRSVAASDTGFEPRLLDGLGENIQDSFTGTNLLLHAAGFAATPLIIKSGYDAQVHDTFKHGYNPAAISGAVLGSGLGALATIGGLYFRGDRESVGAAFAVAQASAITVTYVMLLKFTTGRAHPTNSWNLSSQEQSEQFQFGFLRNGFTAYGWPSGHVSNTVAVTSALAHYYPDKTWLKWLGVGLSAYMLYAVSAYDTGQMHWFSDGVAGAFMGYAIGSTVGKNARHRLEGITEKPAVVSWLPVVSSSYLGATVAWGF